MCVKIPLWSWMMTTIHINILISLKNIVQSQNGNKTPATENINKKRKATSVKK